MTRTRLPEQGLPEQGKQEQGKQEQGLPEQGLPERGAASVAADVGVQVVDILPVGSSRQSQLEAARRQLAEQQRAMPITQIDDADDGARPQAVNMLSRFTVRDAHGAMRYLIFEDEQPAIGLGARLTIRHGCEVHRDVLVASARDVRVDARDVRVDARGTELSLEQQIWRLERP